MAKLTIPDEQTYADFTVTAAQAAFPFAFAIFNKEDLRVRVNGVDVPQSGFTFTGTQLEGGGYQGGYITLNDAVANASVRVWRRIRPKRRSNFASPASVPVRSIDMEFNKAIAIAQDVALALEDVEAGVVDPELLAGVVGAATDGKLDSDAQNADATFSANAPFLPPTSQPDDIIYSLRDRLQERRSGMEKIPRVLHAGIRAGTSLIPVHTFLQEALDSGAKYIDLPEGVFYIGPTAWLRLTVPGQQLRGSGDGTIIKRLGGAGVPAYPMLVMQGEGNIVTDISFMWEAQASLPPAINNIAFASGVIVMGDGSYVEGLSVHDAWDNGLSFGRFDTTTGVFTAGAPAGGEAVSVYTYNCGCGIRPANGSLGTHQAGGGVNNLNAQGIRFRDCVDWFSRTGWMNDYGPGATSIFQGMISYYAQKSRVTGDSAAFQTEFSRFGGFGCYIAGRAQMQNCEIYEAQGDGVWMDGFSHNCNISGVRVEIGPSARLPHPGSRPPDSRTDLGRLQLQQRRHLPRRAGRGHLGRRRRHAQQPQHHDRRRDHDRCSTHLRPSDQSRR